MSFLHLPVEIYHRIFDYLDTSTLFNAIRCSSKSLYEIVNIYDRFKLTFNLTRNYNFELIFNLIHPMNIVSLSFSIGAQRDWNVLNSILSNFNVEKFTRLRSLTLLEVDNDQLDLFLKHFQSFSFVSLTYQLKERNNNRSYPLVSATIRCPYLRKLELINFGPLKQCLEWPSESKLTNLTIKGCDHQQYCFILGRCPFLKTLNVQDFSMYYINSSASQRVFYPSLIRLTIDYCYSSVEHLLSILSLTPSLIYLKLTCFSNYEFSFNGNQWEHFLKAELKLLRHFDFCFGAYPGWSNGIQNMHSIISQYQTPFWLEDKSWFVTCDCIIGSKSTKIMLYTIPYDYTGFEIIIRCEALCKNDICYLTKSLPNQLRETNEKDFIEMNFGNVRRSSCHVRFLSCALQHNQTVTNLNLKQNSIGSSASTYLSNALINNKTIVTLNLEKNEISPREIMLIADALKKNKTLNTLHLGGNNIQQDGIKYLISLFQNNSTLTKLYLGGNHIGSKGIVEFANSLENNSVNALKELDLQDNQIEEEGIKALSDSLKKNTTLIKLDLSSNEIKASDVSYLSDMIKMNRTLESLSLRDNEVRDAGIQYLSRGLEINVTLTELIFQFNHIGDDGIEYLADALKSNKTLKTLNLNNNLITDLGVKYLSDGLEKNKTLKILDLARNKIGSSGAKHVANALKINNSLETLDLSDNRLKDRGIQYLASAFELNQSLTVLDVKSNWIGDDGAQSLVKSLQKNKKIQSINLQYNSIDNEIIFILNDLIKKNQ